MLHVFMNKCLCLDNDNKHSNMFGKYSFTIGKIYDYQLGLGDTTFFIKADDNGKRIQIYTDKFRILSIEEYREIMIDRILNN